MLKNKLLEETHLTSTSNKYLDINLIHSIDSLLGHAYLTSENETFHKSSSNLVSTKAKYLKEDGLTKKKKCKRAYTFVEENNFKQTESLTKQAKKNYMIHQRKKVTSRNVEIDDSTQMSDSDLLDSSELIDLPRIPASMHLEAPLQQLWQQSCVLNAHFNSAGSTGFGSAGSTGFGSAGSTGFGSAGSICFGSAYSATSENIPETVITHMPSYNVNTLNIEDATETDNFISDIYYNEQNDKSTYKMKCKKLQFMNVVNMALLYSSNLKDSEDSYQITLLKLADGVRLIDPEFILKMALYARQELQIRAVSNFLLSYASLYPEVRIYLEKYFADSVVLPSDWIQVAEYYQVLKGATNSFSLPSALRCVMIKKFSKFDQYQIAKYNKDKNLKSKPNKADCDNNKSSKVEDKKSQSKRYTLKNLIRTLHIKLPIETVMCLLGKKYPENYSAFQSSGLPGKWDSTMAGKRMKLPIPETWETQISSHGNKPSIWENLIDKNKLPYMAMLRNLRNLLLAGISSTHHKKVVKQIENKKSVLHSHQLPMQYYEAYKTLSCLENMLKEEKYEQSISYVKKICGWKRTRIEKEKMKLKNVSMSVIEEYKNAVSNALEISSLHNLNPIPGKTLVLCDISSKQTNKNKPKLYETCLLMGLMCMKASEDCKMTVLGSDSSSELILRDSDSFLDTMITNCRHFQEMHSNFSSDIDEDSVTTVSTLKNTLESYLKPQTMYVKKLDHIVFLRTSSDISFGMKDVILSFLMKYRKIVNPELLYTDVDFSLNHNRFSDASLSGKDLYLCGSSSSLIKFIADRSSGGQLTCVENIDLKFNLPDISPLKTRKKLTAVSQNETIIPIIIKEPKWQTVRIFISSTFKDMLSERDLLVRYIFPELRRRAASIFVKIVEIDLRWGITEADSSTKRAAELCVMEAQRSDLFVGFLGERYGTIYNFEPPDSPELAWLRECPSGLSITELEIHAAALRNPESRRNRAFFYFRHNSFLRHIPKKWVNHFLSEDFGAKSKIEELKLKLKHAGFRVFDGYPCHFAGIFENKPILSGLDALGDKVLEDLWTSVEGLHREVSSNVSENEEELYQQNLIDSLNFYVGLKNSPIDLMIKNLRSHKGIFVLVGENGCGKTACCIELLQKIDWCAVVKYFVGISARSRDVSYMIQNICSSVCKQLSMPLLLPQMPEDIVSQFSDFLVEAANCCGGMNIVLVIDGLDLLEPNDQQLDWLPLFLPANIKIICSVSGSSQAFKVLSERHSHGSSVYFHTISPLQQSDREQFIKNYLSYFQKTLDDSAFNNYMLKIVTKKDSSNPRYLRIVCDFLRIYGSFDNLATVVQKLPSTMTLLLQEIILGLENEFGTSLVQSALLLLCICKLGLEDSDFHNILSFIMTENSHRMMTFDALKGSIHNLEPEYLLNQVKYCSLMHIILTFAYGHLRPTSFSLIGTNFESAIKKFYLNKNYDSICKHLHAVVAAYFLQWCDLHHKGKYSGKSGFAIRAILYHMFEGQLYKELSDLLCNHYFVEAVFKAKAEDSLLEYYTSLLFSVLEKNQKLNREVSYNDLYAFYDFVSRNFHIFQMYPQLVMQQALNEPSDSIVKLNKERLNTCFIENISQFQVLNFRLATISGFIKSITASLGEKQTPLVFLGSENGFIKVLDLSTRKVIHSVKGHFSAITSICYASKNRICVSSVDGTLSLWDSKDFTRVAVLAGHRHNVSDCCADPSGCILFSSGWDNSVRLWSLGDGRSISVVDDFKCPVNCVDHHPMKQQIACGLWNGSIQILDTMSMEKKNIFQNSCGSVKSICYSPDGISIISCFMDSEISILSSEEGLKMSSLKGHILPVKSLAFSYDNDAFISGSEDCTLKVWSSLPRSDYSVIEECKSCPISLMEFMLENLLAIAFQNSDICIIDIISGKAVTKFNLAPDIASCFSKYSPSTSEDVLHLNTKECLILGTQSGKLMIQDFPFSSSISLRYEMESKITAALHNSDIILCGCADGDIGLFSVNEYSKFRIVNAAHKGFITNFSLVNQDETLFALSSSNDNALKLWSISRHSFDITLENDFHNKHKDVVTCSILCSPIDPENHNFITGSHDNNIILWNDASVKVLRGLHSSIVNISCSEDFILGCGNDGSVVIWSVNGNILSSIPGIESSSTSLTFFISKGEVDPFIVLLAYVERDGSIKITKPLQRSFCHSLEGHLKPITSCCTTKTGEIISCSLDGSVNLWKMPTDVNQKHSYHDSVVTGILISPSCEFVLSSDANGNIILWKTDFLSVNSSLMYCAKKSFNNGFIRGLAWLKNDRFVCAVTQRLDSQEKYFWAILSVEKCSVSEDNKIALHIKDLQNFKHEISCLDSCSETDVVVIGLKSGDIVVISPNKQKSSKMSDDWLLGVNLFTRVQTSDFFCAAFVNGCIKLFSVADFLNSKDIPVFAVYEQDCTLDKGQLISTLCCGMDSLIVCGDFEGGLKLYAQHSLKLSKKVHQGTITGICIVEQYIFTCALDRTVKVWNISSFKQVSQFHSHVPITCLAAQRCSSIISSGHTLLAFGTKSGEVQLLKYYSN